MSEQVSLDSILDQTPAEKPATVSAVETPPETVAEAPKQDETGEKPPEAAPPAAQRDSEQGRHVPVKALEDERRKRQELERLVADLQRQVQQPQQRPQAEQPPQQPPDPWTDPEGAFRYQQQQFENQLYQTRVSLSRAVLMGQKSDFEEYEKVFFETADANPGLYQQLRQHQSPAQFAYDMGRKIKMQREIGDDPEAYKARLREELMAEIQSQQAPQQAPQSQAAKAPPPKSLAGTPSAQPRDDRGRFAGPASLEDILGG